MKKHEYSKNEIKVGGQVDCLEELYSLYLEINQMTKVMTILNDAMAYANNKIDFVTFIKLHPEFIYRVQALNAIVEKFRNIEEKSSNQGELQ